jgi:hypothetical protein
MFLPQRERPKFHNHKTVFKMMVLYILTLMFLDSKQEDKKILTEW